MIRPIQRCSLAIVVIVASVLGWSATIQVANAELMESYHKSDAIQNMPDFGQVSRNWCWAAAAANSLYWYGKHGYPEIFDDPTNPGVDQNLDPNPPVAGPTGAHPLVEEVARIANKPFSTPIFKNQYLNALNQFLLDHGIHASQPRLPTQPSGMVVHDIVSDPVLLDTDYAGPSEDPFGSPTTGTIPDEYPDGVHPGIKVEVRDPSFDDLRRELGRSQDVLLWLCPDGAGICHVVTAEGWDPDPTSPTGWKITIADPWTPDPPGAGPDNNIDPNRMSLEMYQVLNVNPFRIAYGQQKVVHDMIFISPVPEPTTVFLAGFAVTFVLAVVRRRR